MRTAGLRSQKKVKKIIYICDQCMQEIKGNPTKLFAESVDRGNGDFMYDDPHPELKTLDFCRGCGEFWVNLIKKRCEKESSGA